MIAREIADAVLALPPDRLDGVLGKLDDETFAALLRAAVSPGWEAEAVGVVRGERRKAVVQSLAGSLMARGTDPYLVLATASAWSRCHCIPPLDEREVEDVCEWVAAREAERRIRRAA